MLEIVDGRTSPARIKVFGVGGGGSNAVNRMIQAGLSGVDFWVANTDLQALEKADCSSRLQIGRAVTRGLGAGGDPEIGRLSGEEDREEIADVLRGADMLFITAGMGGGTGTGAAPVVAEVARDLGILTVAIVTKPFLFEGKKKMNRAQAGLAQLSSCVDTLIVIPNQKLLNIVEPGTPFRAAMLVADEVLFQATRGISDLITGHGEINLDFADVKTVMRNRGNALLGCGVAGGKNRGIEAAQAAVSSPLLDEVSITGAEALLINVQGGPNMGLHEAAEAAQFISERVGEDADVFWGAVVDPDLGDEMRVTLIATGFPRAEARPDESEVLDHRRATVRLETVGEMFPRAPQPAVAVRPEPANALRSEAVTAMQPAAPMRTDPATTVQPATALRSEPESAALPETERVPAAIDPFRSESFRPESDVEERADREGGRGNDDEWRIGQDLDAELFLPIEEPRRSPATEPRRLSIEEPRRSPVAEPRRLPVDEFRRAEAEEFQRAPGDEFRRAKAEDARRRAADEFRRPPGPDPRRLPAEEPRPVWKDSWMPQPGEDTVLEARLGRRNPLDEPAFMRKRMD